MDSLILIIEKYGPTGIIILIICVILLKSKITIEFPRKRTD
jgi:hypothetical protein